MTVEDLVEHIRGIEAVVAAGGRANDDTHRYATAGNIKLLVALVERLKYGADNPGIVMRPFLEYGNRVTVQTEVDAP